MRKKTLAKSGLISRVNYRGFIMKHDKVVATSEYSHYDRGDGVIGCKVLSGCVSLWSGELGVQKLESGLLLHEACIRGSFEIRMGHSLSVFCCALVGSHCESSSERLICSADGLAELIEESVYS